jgi:ubiquinone/menaquinone biosynthesis C-methylase UbiE
MNIEKFDAIASQYDTAERIESANIVLGALREYVREGKNKSALDYGCGTGLVGLRLLDSFGSLLLMDASANMVDVVNGKIARLGADNVTAICCNFMEAYPTDVHVDYIIVVMVLLHEKDTRTLLSRLSMALNPGGHLIIVDFDTNDRVTSELVHPGFDQRELAAILRGLSFVKMESKTFYQGERLFMNQDASLFILDAVKK